MSRIMKFITTIRNNWKKSVVGAAAFSYGVSYSIESYETEQLMREYSQEALKYGRQAIPATVPPRHVTVILNPTAKKRKSKKLFEKYCEPLLHLAGISVTILQTESEGHARSLIENLETPTDAIIVAGGDGTLSDVVTGLMRKYAANMGNAKKCPIGVLPLGQTNRLADTIFNDYEDLADVRKMADSVMAVVKGSTKQIDVVEVQPLEKDPENDIKPVYGVGIIEWGAWRDAQSRINKYWYWGYLRRYMTYVFTGYKSDVNWDCNATIRFSEPCRGCSRCYNELQTKEENSKIQKRWWQTFIPRKITQNVGPDYSKISNEKCGVLHEMPVSTTELFLTTDNIENSDPGKAPAMKIKLGLPKVSYTEFVSEGWRRVHGAKTEANPPIEAKIVELVPNKTANFKNTEPMFSIDNEEFELKSVKIRLLPQCITIFCPSANT